MNGHYHATEERQEKNTKNLWRYSKKTREMSWKEEHAMEILLKKKGEEHTHNANKEAQNTGNRKEQRQREEECGQREKNTESWCNDPRSLRRIKPTLSMKGL